ncbi:MAG TPA: ABC transporter permease [Gemmatimonadaceae bacterium]|nr:ABC transporter permease [Gemmatimonadaceae bacterium]
MPQYRSVVDAVRYDIAYALRSLRKSPGFAAVVIVTLALGIGANAALFTVVDRLLLRPPSLVHDPQTVARVYVHESFPGSAPITRQHTMYAEYSDLRTATHAFSGVATYLEIDHATLAAQSGANPETVNREGVSASFFPLLGVHPALGRFFTEDEDRIPRGTPVAILSHRLWEQRFGGDARILGQTVRLDGEPYTVIGVAPEGFSGVDLDAADIWVPVSVASADAFGSNWYHFGRAYSYGLLVRLRPGVPMQQANAEATAALRRGRMEQPHADQQARVELGSIIAARGPGDTVKAVGIMERLIGVTVIVLLIACANIANLLLARAAHRRREIAVRLALGISRRRLVGQLMSESVLLAVLGGAAAILIAFWGGALLRSLAFPGISWAGPPVDFRVLAFTAAITLATALLTGLVPALHASRADLTTALKEGWRARLARPSAIRSGLLVVQAALSVVLLVGAGLYVRSLERLRSVDLGMDASKLIVVSATLDSSISAADRDVIFQHMAERLRALPGVAGASRSSTEPLLSNAFVTLRVPGRDSLPRGNGPYFTAASPGFLATLGARLERGRGFTRADRLGAARVAIVSSTMARLVWPNERAIGKCLKVGSDTAPCTEVVGVVHDIHVDRVIEDPAMHVYVPLTQAPPYITAHTIVVRSAGDPAALVQPIRAALRSVLPQGTEPSIDLPTQYIGRELRPWRLGVLTFGIFGALALAVAAVGLYSVVSYGVEQRTREMGIRVALGARAGDVARLVIAQSVRVILVGVALGLVIALAAGHVLAALLYDTSVHDPVVFGAVAVVLMAVAVVASAGPARRATRVDPCIALREE